MPTGRVLVGAGTGYTAGGTGGNTTVTLTVAQLPSHSHANTLTAAGGHSHTRGSMEIAGQFDLMLNGTVKENTVFSAFGISNYSGVFYPVKTANTDWHLSVGNIAMNQNGHNSPAFAASRNWSGTTNTVANHNHTITNASAGGGSAVNIEQPWLAVYMWKRTK